MRTIVIDIETNLAHDTIWCLSYTANNNGTVITATVTKPDSVQAMLDDYDHIVAHNGIGFDFPVLERVWGVTVPVEKQWDTLCASRLLSPTIQGGHSLRAWGERLGYDKMHFDVDDFDAGLTDEMIEYCERDTKVNMKLYDYLVKELGKWGDYERAFQLEQATARIIKQQESNGFKLDVEACYGLRDQLAFRMADIEEELHTVFPPIIEERYSERTGKRLKDKVEVFNVGSRQQVGKRLKSLGWKPKKFTPSGQPMVDETILEGIELPEAQLISEYMMLGKRVSMMKSWLDKVDHDTGRIHGRVNSNGAVTGRMTHSSPNMGQIPSTKKPFGKEIRSLFTVEDGNVLVGSDLSGIELRCLAHYMQDEEYTDHLLNGDIHTKNQEAAGLETRDQAKTFIYATLYGAGAAKIGSIVGGGSKEGQQLLDNFFNSVPKLRQLKDKVSRIVKKSGSVPALDGRRIEIRSDHSALNALFQSAGAVVAKQWNVCIHENLAKAGIEVKQVAMVHDEVQIECSADVAEQVAQICRDSAFEAGELLEFRVPVAAEADIGKNWYDTH